MHQAHTMSHFYAQKLVCTIFLNWCKCLVASAVIHTQTIVLWFLSKSLLLTLLAYPMNSEGVLTRVLSFVTNLGYHWHAKINIALLSIYHIPQNLYSSNTFNLNKSSKRKIAFTFMFAVWKGSGYSLPECLLSYWFLLRVNYST